MAEDEQDVAMADSSSSDDDTMDDELSNNISSLMKTVEESPYSYDVHLQLIALLRKSGSIDPLRDARENMNKHFPLSPDIWLAWIRDESSRAESVEDKEQILKLCRRAVSEYLSVDVWLEYCQLSIGLLACEDGPARVRQVFDSAISAAGLHFTNGSLLWEAYREFELIMYAAVKEAGGEEAAAARDRVSSLYQRQLRVPLSGCDATWAEYESWCSEHDIQPDDNAKRDHQLAMKRLPELVELEKLVSGDVAGTGSVAGYQQYVRHELSAGSPTRVLHVLERAVADVCLSDQLWQTYTRYVDGQLRPEHHIRLAVHERAVRNLPWSATLWQHYLLAAERAGKPDEHMQELMTRALSSGLQTPVDYQTVWLTWLEYSHRRLRSQTVTTESPSAATVDGDSLLDADALIDAMRAQFEKASQQLAELFGLDGDPEYALLQYWAAVEASCGQLQRAQQLWNDILSQGVDKSAKLWLQYVRLVRRYGTTKQVRKLLQRAMEHTVDWPECILELWMEFERECGTLDTWDDMHYRYRVRMKRVEELRKKQAEREGGGGGAEAGEDNRRRKGGKEWRKPAKQKSSDKPTNVRQSTVKSDQKRASDPNSLESKWRQKADSKPPVSGSDAAGFKVPPPPGYTGAKKGAGDTAIPPPPGYTAAKRGMDDAAKPPSSKRAKAEAADRADPERDSRTLFVSNLDYSVTAEQLADTFSGSVSVADIRIVKDYRGRSKGFSYLELTTIGDADAALKMDRAAVAGRPCFVSRLKKDGQPSDAAFKFNTGLEKNKLFIRGLPTTATVDDVTAFFSTHGEVKEARIVTYRNGHSKGLAYVEFTRSAAASQAVIATDQQVFAGKVISVAISDPPRRDTSLANPHSTAARSLGAGAKTPATGRGRGGRVQLSFTPRALRPGLKPGDQSRANGTADTSDTTAAAAKSNDQFRQMLLSEHK